MRLEFKRQLHFRKQHVQRAPNRTKISVRYLPELIFLIHFWKIKTVSSRNEISPTNSINRSAACGEISILSIFRFSARMWKSTPSVESPSVVVFAARFLSIFFYSFGVSFFFKIWKLLKICVETEFSCQTIPTPKGVQITDFHALRRDSEIREDRNFAQEFKTVGPFVLLPTRKIRRVVSSSCTRHCWLYITYNRVNYSYNYTLLLRAAPRHPVTDFRCEGTAYS